VALFEPLFRALNDTGARYVVVGGLATVLHGYARFTADAALVVDLAPSPATRLIAALTGLGFVPRAPVDAADFAEATVRERWIREQGLQVFSLVDRANPMRVVDLFVTHPIDFDALWSRAEVMSLGSTEIRVASIDDLITMRKVRAGRRISRIFSNSSGSGCGVQDAMSDTDGVSSAAWKTVTWDGNRDALLDSTLAATPAQRLAWLEDAIEIAYRAGASSNRAAGDAGTQDGPPPESSPEGTDT